MRHAVGTDLLQVLGVVLGSALGFHLPRNQLHFPIEVAVRASRRPVSEGVGQLGGTVEMHFQVVFAVREDEVGLFPVAGDGTRLDEPADPQLPVHVRGRLAHDLFHIDDQEGASPAAREDKKHAERNDHGREDEEYAQFHKGPLPKSAGILSAHTNFVRFFFDGAKPPPAPTESVSPSSFLWIPRDHPHWLAAFCLQLGAGLVLFWIERSGTSVLPRRGRMEQPRIPGSVLIALVPGLLAYLWLYVGAGAPESAYHLFLLFAFFVLFVRRFVEALWFRRRLSADPGEVAATAAGYLAFGLVAGFLQNHATGSDDVQGWMFSYVTAIGIVLYLLGVIVNSTQHRNLTVGDARMDAFFRRFGGRLPGPHYLGEVAAWLGFAVMSRHLAVYGFALMVTCLIVGRAAAPAQGKVLSVDRHGAD